MNPQYFVHYINMLAALSSGARPATQVLSPRLFYFKC